MAGTLIVDSNFDINGNIKVSTVPNNTGTLLTYNSSTKLLSTRTNTEILSDLGLTSVVSNSHTHSNKTVLDGITSTLVTNWNTGYSYSQVGHLPLVGGNIQGTIVHANFSTTSALIEKNTTLNSGLAVIRMKGLNYDKGFGITMSGDLAFGEWSGANGLSNNWYKLWHSGNFNPSDYSVTSHTHTFASLTSKPTTLSGYGITDAMSTSHVASAITSTNISNWNTAFTNNHTHTNKTVLDGITSTLVTNWNTAFGWGRGLRVDGNGVTVHNVVSADVNLQENSSFYATGLNRPNGQNGSIVNFTPYSNGSSKYGFDLAKTASSNRLWFRSQDNNVYSNWFEIYHSGNFNPSSYSTQTVTGIDNYRGLNGDIIRVSTNSGVFTTELKGISVLDARTSTSLGNLNNSSVTPSSSNIPITTLIPVFHTGWKPGSSAWGSSIIIKGWTSTYQSWMISGPAGTDTGQSDFYLRTSGASGAWNTPQKIFTDYNFNPDDYALITQLNNYALSSHTHTFASLTSKPTTLSGYGITDAMSTSHVANAITSTNISNWNTAFTNNHTHSNKAILDATTASFTTALKDKLDGLSNYTLPTASASVLGGIKVGANLSIDANGVLSATNTNTTYSAGNGLTLSGTQFSLPVTVSGSGSFVQSVTQTTNGITVTLGTPPDNNTTYNQMTSSTLGLGKLFSDTVQSVASNAVTATASRTYGVQVNSSGQLVVNIPWSDTTYSGGTLAILQATSPTTTNYLWSSSVLNQWFDGKSVFAQSTNGGIKTNIWTSNALTPYSIAIGHITSSSGFGALALGYNITTLGAGSANIGYQSTVNGNFSNNVGSFNGNNASKGTTIGIGLNNVQEGCTVVGRFNANTGNLDYNDDANNGSKKVFIVGIGKDSDSRKNALEVTADGKTKVTNNIYYDTSTRNTMVFSDTTLIDKKYFDEHVPSGGGGNENNILDISMSTAANPEYNGLITVGFEVNSVNNFEELMFGSLGISGYNLNELTVDNVFNMLVCMNDMCMSNGVGVVKGHIKLLKDTVTNVDLVSRPHIVLTTTSSGVPTISNYSASSLRTLMVTTRNSTSSNVIGIKLGTAHYDTITGETYFYFNPQIL